MLTSSHTNGALRVGYSVMYFNYNCVCVCACVRAFVSECACVGSVRRMTRQSFYNVSGIYLFKSVDYFLDA